MAKAAPNRRVSKQRWAEPGSWHDWLVRWTKVILPSAVGVLIAVLALAPLGKKSDVSFILDKKKVQNAPERMRVEQAATSGPTTQGPAIHDDCQSRDPAEFPKSRSSIFAACSQRST